MHQRYTSLVCLVMLLVFGCLGAIANPLDRGESVTIISTAGGVRLAGKLRLPQGPGLFPAAVLLTERSATGQVQPTETQLLNSIADFLVREGVAVLRLDERGRGNSQGSVATTTWADRAADAIAALNYLRTRPQLDVARLGLIGHGEGANVALLAGAQPLAPKFVVALAAAGLPGRELLATQTVMYGRVLSHDTLDVQRQRQYRQALAAAAKEAVRLRATGSNAAQVQTYLDQQHMRQKAAMRRDADNLAKQQRAMLEIVRQTPDNAQAQAILANMLRQQYPTISPEDVQSSVQLLTTPAYRSFLAFDPQSTLAQVQCPVLLLQGENDAQVNATVNLQLLKKGLRGNGRVAELRYPGLDHDLQAAPNDQAAVFINAPADIRSWITSQK